MEYLGWVITEYLGWVSTEYLGWVSMGHQGFLSTEYRVRQDAASGDRRAGRSAKCGEISRKNKGVRVRPDRGLEYFQREGWRAFREGIGGPPRRVGVP